MFTRTEDKNMLKDYYPYEYVESVFAIDYNKLYGLGFRGIIFDIDNTLVPHGDDSTPEVDALFEEIHSAGLKTVLLSNNDRERIERFIKNIDTQYVCDAEKPDPAGYLKAVELLGEDKDKVVLIGDQTFSDIIGANNCGIKSILVKFIGFYTEKKLGIRRRIEKAVLFCYRHSKYDHRIGDILKEG